MPVEAGADELAEEEVDLDRIDMRAVPRAFEQHELTTGLLGESDPAARTGDPVLGSLYHEHRAADSSTGIAPLVEHLRTCVAISVSGVVSSPQPTQSSMGFVECGSVNICEKKNRGSRGSSC